MGGTNGSRLPAKPVWMTEKKVERKNPRTGRMRTERKILVRWREYGKAREKSFSDPIQAGRFATLKEDELLGRVSLVEERGLTFGEWRDRYLAPRFTEYASLLRGDADRISNKYLSGLLVSFRRFEETIGDRPLRAYRAADFERFRTTLLERGELRPVTIENYLTRLRTLFRAAEEEGVLTKAPRIRVHRIHYEKPALEQSEIKAIFEAAKSYPPPARRNERRDGDLTGRLYRILATLYYTMMRRGELIHLAWDDIRTNPNGELEVLIQPKEWEEAEKEGCSTRRRWEPKDREIRAIPSHEVVKEILAEQKKVGGHPIWVFTNSRGERWSTGGLASLVARFERATGLKVGFHVWRRSGITHLHDQGVPPGQIQEIAGHSSISTTMKYVRPGSKGRRKAIRSLKRI